MPRIEQISLPSQHYERNRDSKEHLGGSLGQPFDQLNAHGEIDHALTALRTVLNELA